MNLSIRKVVSAVGLLLALAAVLMSTTNSAFAQTSKTPASKSSSINLQNIGSEPADVVINFYDDAGNQVATSWDTGNDPIPAGGALSLYVPVAMADLQPGQYAAVVSSSTEVLASVNTSSSASNSAPWIGFAYDGFDSSEAGETLYFPGNYNNYFGFFSELVIQNAGAGDATVSASFTDANGNTVATKTLGTIKPNAAKTYAMEDLGLPSGNSAGLFGATITATSSDAVSLVGVANIWRLSPTAGTASYSGFTSGSSEVFAPALYKEYFGFGSALTIQNVSTTENAAGSIVYGNGHTVPFNLGPGAAAEFYQPGDAALPSGNSAGVFSAKATATSGSIVGLVSLSVPDGGAGSFASYNAAPEAKAEVKIPNINSDYFGFFTAVTVQNTGISSADITITYPSGQFRTFPGVGGGQTVNILHLNSSGDVLANSTSTSAKVTASNGNPLVAVIQHNTAPGVNGHDASKTPSDFLFAVTGK